jgi:hypothetical protein
MPKDNSERIIDWPYRSNGGSTGISGGGGGGGGTGGATNLDALIDVTISAPLNGQVLAYDTASGQWVNSTSAAAVPNPHGLSSAYHNGTLNWPLINFSGSNLTSIVTRLHSNLQGIGPNDHHNQAHLLATGTALGPDHTISGAAVGEVLRALSATTAAFDQLQHTDLGNVLPDQHHTRAHDIITGDASGPVHTIVGSQWQVVGATAVNTLGLLTATNAPAAAAALLRTDAAGGIQLDTNLFYVDGANNWIGINRAPSGATLDIIAGANADHTQRIRQRSGQTGRMWRIEDLSGNELIILDSVGDLQSGQPGFVSGLTGWQITPQGNAEFNNIWARGELHATVFVKDEVHATGGTLLVATAGVLHDDANISSAVVADDVLVVYSTPAGMGVPLQVVTTSGSFVGNELHVSFIGNTININDPPSGPGFYFQPGDVIRSKTEVDTGVTDFWLEVNSATQQTGYSTYRVTKRSGTDGVLPKGSAVVSYGREGDGRILMTSDLNYAPYLDVFTVGPNVWTGAAGSVLPRVRLGRLDGVGLPGISGVEQYGLVAGSNLSDANSGYLIASNLQFSLYKIDIRLNNGTSDTGLWTAAGNLKLGTNIGAAATTGFQFDPATGDVIIGSVSGGNFLRWQQLSGILTVSGSLVVSDPGTTVTQGYVDTQDQYYDARANLSPTGYAGQAQTNAQNYAEGRRITGVTGTWSSSAANVVTWSALTATFVNGGSRSIAAGNSGTMAARTYLYANIALSGTLTLIATTTPAVSQPSYVLIAVCDPGVPRASVTVVAGTTFISGANIATGSIQAANISASTITGAEIHAGEITSSHLASDVITSISNADSKGQTGINNAAGAQSTANTALSTANTAQSTADNNFTYAENRRVTGVSGTWTVTDGNTIAWTGLQVKFANGNARNITAESAHNLSGTAVPPTRHYLYIDVSAADPLTMIDNTSLSLIGGNNSLIATVDVGAIKASISIVAGSTYISGGNILTESIVSNNIQAGAVSAEKISAATLSAIQTNTGALAVSGALTVGATGNLHSSGKPSYGGTSAPAGYYLGYSGGQYVLDIGNASDYLRWDGDSLLLKTSTPLDITGSGANFTVFTFRDGIAGHVASANFFWDSSIAQGIFSAPALSADFYVKAPRMILSGTSAIPREVVRFDTSGVVSGGTVTWLSVDAATGRLNYNNEMAIAGSLYANRLIATATDGIGLQIANDHSPDHNAGGVVGQICWDDSYLYIYTTANKWHRVQHLAW